MNSPYSSDLWSGRLIGERQRYRLDLRLGEGGMGNVFLAMDTLLGQQVALKLLKETLVGSGELRKRFEREVALSAALKSDHIVQVTDFGVTSEGYPFYVMEYLRGQTLGQLLRHEKKLSVERTVNIILQVCEGLQLAHKGVTLWRDGATTGEIVSVVHRDLKPDNIFLETKAQGDYVKILDFGIAKIRDDTIEHTNLTSMFVGTVHYAAPEQLGVEDLDGRADIYNLGIILYEMLSGTDPFGLGLNINRISSISWVVAHTSKLAVPLRALPNCQHLSPTLEAVVMRCLEKSPDERFASVDQLCRALQVAVADLSGASFQKYPRHNTYQQLQHLLGEEITKLVEVETHQPVEPAQEYGQETMNTHQMRLQHVEPRKVVIDELETQVTEKQDNFYASLRKENLKTRRLLFRLTIGIAAIAAVSLGNYVNTQWQDERVFSAAWENTKTLKLRKKYQECVNQAKSVPEKSRFYVDAQNLLHECQRLFRDEKLLTQAQKLAEKDNFKGAIATVSAIYTGSSFYSQAEQLTSQWSENLLQQAEDLYKQSYNSQTLSKAFDTAESIPENSSVAQKAQEMTKSWRTEWNKNETYLQQAENALKEGKAQEAIEATNEVRLLGQELKQDTPYWKNKIKPIIDRAKGLLAASVIRPALPTVNKALPLKPVVPTYQKPIQPRQSAPIQIYRPPLIKPQPRQSAPIQIYRPPLIKPQPRQPARTQPRQVQKTPTAWSRKIL